MKTIAVAGKGGVGKTTISGLVVRYLKEKELTPILAVDGDPSVNLNITLGMEVDKTIGEIREYSKPEKRAFSISLPEYFEIMISHSLAEGKGIDLIAMGRPEGKGCYCSANRNLREALNRLSSNYKFVVIDNEAGMEHISRQTDGKVDVMLIVSDPTYKSILSAKRIYSLISELENEVSKCFFIVNKAEEKLETYDIDIIGRVRKDEEVFKLELQKKPIFDLPKNSIAYQDVAQILEKINKICNLW